MKAILLWSALALAVLVGVALIVWEKPKSPFVKAFQHAAEAALQSKEQIVVVSAITTFEWDMLMIFEPYTPVEEISAQLGFDWPLAEKTHIHMSDTFYLLVFVKDQRVVTYFKLPRTIGDFQELDAGNRFPRGSDVFEVALETPNSTSRRMNFVPRRTAKRSFQLNSTEP